MMKRTLKRGMSMMMAILLVVGLFGNLGITASAAASVTLYTAGGTITSGDWTAGTQVLTVPERLIRSNNNPRNGGLGGCNTISLDWMTSILISGDLSASQVKVVKVL